MWLCLPGIVKEHTLDRDGPISSVKLYSQSSSGSKSSNGKAVLLNVLHVLLMTELNQKQSNHNLLVTNQTQEKMKLCQARENMKLFAKRGKT